MRQFAYLAQFRVSSQLFYLLQGGYQGGLLAFLLEGGSGVLEETTSSTNVRRE